MDIADHILLLKLDPSWFQTLLLLRFLSASRASHSQTRWLNIFLNKTFELLEFCKGFVLGLLFYSIYCLPIQSYPPVWLQL